MIIGIGCDVVEHSIIEKLDWLSNIELLKKYFSKNELELCNTNITVRFISGRFAVKEAVVKCLGTGIIDGIALDNIEVFQNKSGQPFIKVSGDVQRLSSDLGIDLWHISITHSQTQSIAFVIAERRKA